MSRNAIKLSLTPSFGVGIQYMWSVSPGVVDPLPWEFYVEQCDVGPEGPWVPLSGKVTSVTWANPERLIVSRDAARFFRVKLITPLSSYVSEPVSMNGGLDLRRFNIAREVMRREMLYAQKNSNGMKGEAWLKNVSGSPCTNCLDPVLGSAVFGSDCPMCGGTRFNPPYLGPYEVWATFSPGTRKTEHDQEGVGKFTVSAYEARIAGTAWLRTADIIKIGGHLYNIEGIQIGAEVGQTPLVQIGDVSEIPLGDALYVLETFK